MGWRLALTVLSIVAAVLESAEAQSPNALLSLDSLSFVASVTDHGEQIPISAIPVRIDSQSRASWSLSIDPADVQIPPVTFRNGERVEWSLLEQATGSAVISNGVVAITLSARFLAKSIDTTRATEHHLNFTTQLAKASRGETEVEREGVPLDRTSGYVQLVAAAADPPGSEHAVPFYVVLSGRFTSGPPGFLEH